MARRLPGTDWTGLCQLIESNLRGQPRFGIDLILRLAKRFRSLRTIQESMELLPREAETLRSLARCRLPYPVPRLVCLTPDARGKTIGLIEWCLDGGPLSRFEGGVNGRSRLETIAGVAAAVHQLPRSEFTHLPAHTDSASHVQAVLGAISPSLLEEWPVAADARD